MEYKIITDQTSSAYSVYTNNGSKSGYEFTHTFKTLNEAKFYVECCKDEDRNEDHIEMIDDIGW